MGKIALAPEAHNFVTEATNLLKAHVDSNNSLKTNVKTLETIIKKNAGPSYDAMLSNFLGKPVGSGTDTTRVEGSIEAVQKITANPKESIAPLVTAIGETAIETKCCGLTSIFSCFSSSDAN